MRIDKERTVFQMVMANAANGGQVPISKHPLVGGLANFTLEHGEAVAKYMPQACGQSPFERWHKVGTR